MSIKYIFLRYLYYSTIVCLNQHVTTLFKYKSTVVTCFEVLLEFLQVKKAPIFLLLLPISPNLKCDMIYTNFEND